MGIYLQYVANGLEYPFYDVFVLTILSPINFLNTARLDLLFICFYSFVIYFFFKRLFGKHKILIVGFLPGIFDLIETATILNLLTHPYLQAPSWLGIATLLKWIFLAISIIILFSRVSKSGVHK